MEIIPWIGMLVIALIMAFLFLRQQEKLEAIRATVDSNKETTSELKGTLQSVDSRLVENSKLSTTFQEKSDQASKVTADLGKRLTQLETHTKTSNERMGELSQNISGLSQLLGNDRSRGKFGEERLEHIISDQLPPRSYFFQHRIEHPDGNPKLADCAILMPEPHGKIVIDSKFPMTHWYATQEADTEQASEKANKEFEKTIQDLLKDIGRKYIVPGVTVDFALMFLPSDSIYLEIQKNYPDISSTSQQYRVYIVSPTTIWAMLVAIRSVLKDATWIEHNKDLQKFVRGMLTEAGRLEQRVGKLKSHHDSIDKDIHQIMITKDKIVSAGRNIASLDEREQVETANGETSN